MRILVVSSYPPRHCGIGTYARDQAARLRAAGHDVTVLTPPDGEGDVRVRFEGAKPFLAAARMASRFDRVIVHFQPALYYRPRAPVSKVLASAGLLWLSLISRRLEILVHEADRPLMWRPDYVLLRLALARAARVSFHTELERSSLERHYGVRVRGAVVRHRVDPARVPSREEARERLGIAGRAPVFVCAGFIQPSKGFDRALEAFSKVGAGSLFLVGSVRDRTAGNLAHAEYLRGRCREIAGATFVEGFLDDQEFDQWVASADWLLLPYRRSWSSGVLARGHAVGTPAIVSSVGGLPEQAGPEDLVFQTDEELETRMRQAAAAIPVGIDG